MKIENITLIKTGHFYGGSNKFYFDRYKVLINGEAIENLFSKRELKELPGWKPRTKTFTARGGSENAKIILGQFLKPFKGGNWLDYIKMLNNLIKVI